MATHVAHDMAYSRKPAFTASKRAQETDRNSNTS